MTPVSTLCAEARETARRLLTHYVKVQGLVISQMLRKSVETRDWLSTLEPRNVRAVMKRVVEDTTAIDVQVLPRAGQGSRGAGWGCWGDSPLRIKDSRGQAVRTSMASFLLCPGWWQHRPISPMRKLRPRLTQKIRASVPTPMSHSTTMFPRK